MEHERPDTLSGAPTVQIEKNRFNATGHMQFSVDMMQMSFDGIRRDTELIGDFFIATSPRRTSENLALAIGQHCQGPHVLIAPLTQGAVDGPRGTIGQEWRNDFFALRRPANDPQEFIMVGVFENVAPRPRLHRG